MPNHHSNPILFLAFANDRQATGAYLRNLGHEAETLRDTLATAEQAGLCQVEVLTSASAESILKRFNDPAFKGRIALFHYAGHADDYDLLLESASGDRSIADARGLAAFLRQQTGLHLVFLNACSTRAQVEGLLDAGISAVIATSRAVDDKVATDFSRHFYTALAGGDSIRTAFEKAQAALHFVRGDISRHLRLVPDPAAQHASAGWPWKLYVREGAEESGSWDLPGAAGDPLFGLPPLPEMDLPAKPFRDLSWFRRADAPIFFGRGQQIRALYTTVTDSKDAPIVLFYGQSGVGKSSLLDAGLLPRLEQVQRVVYTRREQEKGLLGTLAKNIPGISADSRNVLDAWRAVEQQTNRPFTLILDQVEEHFTRPNPALADEMEQFLGALVAIFADRAQRPQGKLILSFRKEWLAEIEKRLVECGLPRFKVFLERLDEAGVIEAVRGVVTTPALHRHYGLTIDDGLAGEIAHDLLKDREAPVAPMLQILLTRLWDEATQRKGGNLRFDQALYDQLRRDGLELAKFLDQQLARLKEQQQEVVDSGLALDLLSFHTTPLGATEQRNFATLQQVYRHRESILGDLVRSLQNLYLLVDPADRADTTQTSRLAHDTLAPLVRARFDESDAPGQRARRILQTRAVEWDGKDDPANPTPLDRQDLQVVEAGADGMRVWNAAEQKLIEASQRERARRQKVEQFLWMGGIAAVILIAAFAGFAWWQRGNALVAQDQEKIAKITAETEAENARIAKDAEEKAKIEAQTEAENARKAELTAEARRQEAVNAQAEAERQAENAKRSLAGQLSQTALVVDRDLHLPQRALLLAIEAAQMISPPVPSSLTTLHDLLGRTGGIGLGSHKYPVSSVAFSPDGKSLASGRDDGTIRLWSLDEPAADPVVLQGHTNYVLSVAFSPDGKTLASGSDDNTIQLWSLDEPATDPVVLQGHENSVWNVAFSPDGKTLASGSLDNTIRLWSLTERSVDPVVLKGHDFPVYSVAFSPDGKTLASGSEDRTIHLWSLTEPAADPIVLQGHKSPVSSVAFSPDGKTLASGSVDYTIRLWSLTEPAADPVVLQGYESGVLSVAFSPDGKTLASGGYDKTIRLWSLAEPATDPVVLQGHDSYVNSVAFSPDSMTLASGSEDSTIRLWSLTKPAVDPVVLQGHEANVNSVAFSPDGMTLANGSWDSTIRLWSLTEPATDPVVLQGHDSYVNSVAFSPDSKTLASGSGDKTIRLWSLTEPAVDPIVLQGHEDDVNSVAFSPDSKTLASGSGDGTIRLWSLAELAADPLVLIGHTKYVSSVAFSPDGKTLASGSMDNTIRLWSLAEPAADLFVLHGHTKYVSSVAFSPDGKMLASGSDDKTIRQWSLNEPSADPVVLHGHESSVSSVAFSPDGKTLASGSDDAIRLWSLKREDLLILACRVAGRNLSGEEWRQYFGESEYRRTCPQWPAGE